VDSNEIWGRDFPTKIRFCPGRNGFIYIRDTYSAKLLKHPTSRVTAAKIDNNQRLLANKMIIVTSKEWYGTGNADLHHEGGRF
jgi:hypothetical protein